MYLSENRLKNPAWTKKETKLMLEMAKQKTSMEYVYATFKPRTKKAINSKIVRMYLSRKNDILQILP